MTKKKLVLFILGTCSMPASFALGWFLASLGTIGWIILASIIGVFCILTGLGVARIWG